MLSSDELNGVHENGVPPLFPQTCGDAVCIVGMACHLPGGIKSPSGLWDFLRQGKTSQSSVPSSRYNTSGYYQRDGSGSGIMNMDGGHFLQEDVRQFDASFFGINNLEASYMDPQQRKLLETVYECFEDAGVSMQEMSGSDTACLVGNFTTDHRLTQTRDPDLVNRFTGTGGGTAIMSNRVSHVFNLNGPSMTLDTGCSSTIYALHYAVTSIKAGDCDGALVAGANLILSPEQQMEIAKAGVLSPTSACHTFDTSADGYGRAEAISCVYIKSLSSSIRDGNRIHAIIRGTAINANGRTSGISLPDAKMQEIVVRKAYKSANLDFTDTDYVECHGTGTAVGDPIEVEGLASCFGGRPGEAVRIGSVKTNLGHSEAASGLTSIIKVALAIKYGIIPPTFGIKNLNPKLKLEERNMRVVCENEPWTRALRRASVNSFGYGGANAHVIMESYESFRNTSATHVHRGQQLTNGTSKSHFTGNGVHANGTGKADGQLSARLINGTTPDQSATSRSSIWVLPFSAASSGSLDARREQVTRLTRNADAQKLERLAHALAGRSTSLRLRDYILASTNQDEAFTNVPEVEKASRSLPFAFVFTGQGAQYAHMGKELLEQDESFLATIRQLDSVLSTLPESQAPDWTLEQTILDDASISKVNDVARSQPLCTAIQIALVDLLRAWDVTPTAVIGHSSGEIAASYASGHLTATQAILAAYFRGLTVSRLESRGAMMAANVGPEFARDMIAQLELKEVCVACVNAPESVTLSGAISDIDALEAELKGRSKLTRKLETGGQAYHSHMMLQAGDSYEDLIRPYFGNRGKGTPAAHMFSTVGYTPDDLDAVEKDVHMASYFRRNLERPVQFSTGLLNVLKSGNYHMLEIGPHCALKGPVQQIRTAAKFDRNSHPYSATLVRKTNGYLCLRKLAGTLFNAGHELNWRGINGVPEGNTLPDVDLPPYPWDYSKPLPWHEPRVSAEIRDRKHIRHELLGSLNPGGNGIEWNWRNRIRPEEVAWLREHKLGDQVVLPGSAYLSMAMEALSQVRDRKTDIIAGGAMSIEFQNVSFNAVFHARDDKDAAAEHTEMHTIMYRRKAFITSSSADWYDFAFTSWASGNTKTHCTGSIREVRSPMSQKDGVLISSKGFEKWQDMSRWYQKDKEESLNFGPLFQSVTGLRTDSNRSRTEVIAETRLDPPCDPKDSTFYAIHPITLDACFQTAVMANTAGNLSSFRAYVPAFLTHCRIDVLQGGARVLGDQECEVHTTVAATGPNTRNADCTLRLPNGAAAIDIKSLRMNLFSGRAPVTSANDIHAQRQPCLRVSWNPDILRTGEESLDALIDHINAWSERQSEDANENGALVVFGALLELAGFKTPQMRVLEFGQVNQWTAKMYLEHLGVDTAYPRCKSWSNGRFDEDRNCLVGDAAPTEPFDVVLVPHNATARQIWDRPEALLSLVSDKGMIVTRNTESALTRLRSAGFTTLELPRRTILAIPRQQKSVLEDGDVLIIKPNESSTKIDMLADAVQSHIRKAISSRNIHVASLDQVQEVNITEKLIVISLLEIENAFLANISSSETNVLKSITDKVSNIIWLTGTNMLATPNPNLTLANGLSRALMLEQPALRFSILDIGGADLSAPAVLSATCTHILRILTPRFPDDDKEFLQHGTLLYISRFHPDFDLNTTFRQRLLRDEPLSLSPLRSLGPANLTIGSAGRPESLHFARRSSAPEPCPAGHVEVEVKVVGLNADDVETLYGRTERPGGTLMRDFAGVVREVGPGVEGFEPGDRVLAMGPNCWGRTEKVPVGFVKGLREGEDWRELVSLLTAQATALYALRDWARLRRGERVLVHDGAGKVGRAMIEVAKRMGAEVFATVASDEKKKFLVAELGVRKENVFSSRDELFVKGIMAATGRGVDVVVNSSTGDLSHASWDCIAPHGRFVEVGKRDLAEAGKLDMRVFTKNAAYTAIDLSDLALAEDSYYHDICSSLLTDVVELHRAGEVKPGRFDVFDVSRIAEAYRYLNKEEHVSNVVVSMENLESRVQVAPAQYTTRLHPEKSYLLVGCLGGLGRSLTRWMMSRGARKLVFLGRSGCDRPSAQRLVSQLKDCGATVAVVRGDVSNAGQVKAAVAACTELGPIGGVVQAAMGLGEALFTSMTNTEWHDAIQPKWSGTWNLHNELSGHDAALDFFLMTSSMSGSCGAVAESNYCAANAFLDAFSYWRRSQGKPAISVGLGMISEVGYLHEHPEVEARLLRKGGQTLSEEEFLQVIDFGLSSPRSDSGSTDGTRIPANVAHILTGLEFDRVRELRKQGYHVSNNLMEDPRSSILMASFSAALDITSAATEDAGQTTVAAEWMRDVPSGARGMFGAEAGAKTMFQAILNLTQRRFSNIILTPFDQVDVELSLGQFGMDSMLAAEFRAWVFATFQVNIPLLNLISSSETIKSIAAFVETNLLANWAS